MFASAIVYLGLLTAFVGFVSVLIPLRFLRIRTRRRGAAIFAIGVLIVVIGFVLPAPERRVAKAATHLDESFPRWQFHEHHEAHVAATPERVFAAIHEVRADEILLFRLLTWIRRGGRDLPENILNAGAERPLLDVATSGGFIYLADDPPREVVVGTVVVAPPGTRGKLTPDVFRKQLPPGFALAGMNFVVTPDGKGGSIVTTETRVYANSDSARRRFAAYWRVIYPGSALIRRMWLRAIVRRAELSTERQ
ncbi:MAG TPA: hypothetical protein VGQ36_07445 [Thermoanaerobaculia bacterium]|nr:hypothetical protein [Thermoanaerobaculia bacterium]